MWSNVCGKKDRRKWVREGRVRVGPMSTQDRDMLSLCVCVCRCMQRPEATRSVNQTQSTAKWHALGIPSPLSKVEITGGCHQAYPALRWGSGDENLSPYTPTARTLITELSPQPALSLL